MAIVYVRMVIKILMMTVTVKKVGKLQILKKNALHHLQLLLLLACTACGGAHRECKDGVCVCEDGYQEIDCVPAPSFEPMDFNRCECEKGRKITDIKELHYITFNCFYF